MDLQPIQNKIYEIRGRYVMLDFDLAVLYGVETKSLNLSVKRNMKRFPDDFMFQLSLGEWNSLRLQIETSKRGGRRYLPYALRGSQVERICRRNIYRPKRYKRGYQNTT